MYIGDHARERPDATAIALWPAGRELTWRQLYEGATRLGNLFRSAGLKEGDNVAIFSYNHLRFLEVAAAALHSGMYLTAVNAHSTLDEAAYVVNDCGADALIVSDSTMGVAAELVERSPGVRLRLTMDATSGGHVSIDEATAGQPAEPTVAERMGAYMFYSSGTTGRPKGIRPPLPDAPASAGDLSAAGVRYTFMAGDDPVYLSPAPLHHAAPLRVSLNILGMGGQVVVMERFDPEGALAAIERHRVTSAQWVPTMFVRMLKLAPEVRDRYDISSLGRAVHAAAPCPIWAKERIIEWWGPIVHEYYAGSENIGSTAIDSEQWLSHKGSVGRTIGETIHVCDADGNELAPGQDGLVYFEASDDKQFEYHGDPEKTAAIWHPARRWRTLGDIGHLDEEGYLYLSDRATFMIVSGGANVYPQEIEHVLLAHPGVEDAAVVGVPDDDLGEVPLAIVQPAAALAAGAGPEALVADPGAYIAELRALCVEKLAGYKVPARFELRASLPRGEDGKLRKKPLRDAYWPDGRGIA